MLDLGFAGVDPDYATYELDADRAENGANNFTVEPASGLAPASAYAHLFVARPPSDWQPQYHGHECMSRYPLHHCPFPGLCAPATATHNTDDSRPCAVWHTGQSRSLQRALDSGMSAHRDPAASRRDTQDYDAPGRWIDSLWHPCAYVPAKHSSISAI